MKESLKLTSAALDVFTDAGGVERFVLRGVLGLEGLDVLRTDKYQREVLSRSKINALARALESSSVPDIEIGMRGEKHRVHSANQPDEAWYMQDDLFIIDGLQRVTAAKQLRLQKPDLKFRRGAAIHFNTNFDWERARFRNLNLERAKISTNLVLRNLETDQPAIEMFIKLCKDQGFVLVDRVQWNQRQARSELISALTLCKVTGILHSRFGPGRGNQCEELAASLTKTMGVVGRTTMRDNVKTFFELIDECYGVRRITFADGATFLKTTFLVTLADVLTHHKDFWRGSRLFVEKDLRVKLSKFPIMSDPQVIQLASSGGASGQILFQILVNHINSGKRSKRLTLDVTGNEFMPLQLGKDAPKETASTEAVAA